MFTDFFKKNKLDGKIIYLIANNNKIKNINSINNINLCNDSIIIRFNGDPHNLLKKIFVDRCDIMFYRSNLYGSFNNLKKNNIKNYNTIVFTEYNQNNAEICTSFKKISAEINIKNLNYAVLSNKNSKLSPTTGFSVLENILENINYKKIFLIGFSNLTRKNIKKNERLGCHSIYNENQYFHNYILKNYSNIDISYC